MFNFDLDLRDQIYGYFEQLQMKGAKCEQQKKLHPSKKTTFTEEATPTVSRWVGKSTRWFQFGSPQQATMAQQNRSNRMLHTSEGNQPEKESTEFGNLFHWNTALFNCSHGDSFSIHFFILLYRHLFHLQMRTLLSSLLWFSLRFIPFW